MSYSECFSLKLIVLDQDSVINLPAGWNEQSASWGIYSTGFLRRSIVNCHQLKTEYSFVKAIYIRVATYSCSLLYLEAIFVLFCFIRFGGMFRIKFSWEFIKPYTNQYVPFLSLELSTADFNNHMHEWRLPKIVLNFILICPKNTCLQKSCCVPVFPIIFCIVQLTCTNKVYPKRYFSSTTVCNIHNLLFGIIFP